MIKNDYKKPVISEIIQDLSSPHNLIRAIFGPRQVGKTTAAKQIIEDLNWPSVYESADSTTPHSVQWIVTHWVRARKLAQNQPAILILDEIHQVHGWSKEVKRLWDEDRFNSSSLRVLILGSSALLMQSGLEESLAGRFFSYRFTHWNYEEMKQCFGFSLEEWLYFGGYPGAAPLCDQEGKWKQYVNDSLVETALARDVFQLKSIRKPTLMRQLFGLASSYPARVVSYNKMLGQLQDAGNTVTLAEYLRLLEGAFLVQGLETYSGGIRRKRGSSPKLIVMNNALVNSSSNSTFSQTLQDPRSWGWLVENAVGAHLCNSLSKTIWSISYWRRGDYEVDFVLTSGEKIIAIEVKSGRERNYQGFAQFRKLYPKAKAIMVGPSGLPLSEFFSINPEESLQCSGL